MSHPKNPASNPARKMARNRAMGRIGRKLIFIAAFLLPPIIIGITFAVFSMAKVMVHDNPDPLAAELTLPAPPVQKQGQKTAVIVLSPAGTQLTEVLSAAQTLGEQGYRILTIAPARRPLRTTGAVSILPHVAFSETPQADTLVIPSVLDPADSKLQEFVRRIVHDTKSLRRIIVLGEGVTLMADAGLLDSKKVTTHFIAFSRMQRAHPEIQLITDQSFVSDGNILSSEGLAATQRAIQGHTTSDLPRGLKTTDYLHLVFRAGLDWNKQSVAVILEPGLNELSIAAPLEILPRTFSIEVETLAEARIPIRTRHGLDLIPTEISSDALPFDYLFYPEGKGAKSLSLPPPMGQPIEPKPQEMKDPFAQWLTRLSKWENPAIAHLVARLIRVSRDSAPPATSDPIDWIPFPQILLLGFLGLLLAWLVDSRIKRRTKPHN